MDITTLLGLLLGFFGLIFGFIVEGGHIGSLASLPAFIIVVGGTAGATIVGTPLSALKKMPQWLKIAFKNQSLGAEQVYNTLIHFSEKARREGLLSLEQELAAIENKSIHQGMQLVIDGTDPEMIKDIMESSINAMENRHKIGIATFEAAGGFSPTMGIIGTVMGLIHVLGNLTDPEALSSSIAGAFAATLYGVALANVFFLPIANKLKTKNKQEVEMMEMILDGIVSIQSGENPSILKEKLKTHLGYTPNNII
ncbi:MAG: flagellar motor protein [Bacillota bacterium]|jgi:chemotaxis protein MotA